MFEKNLRIGFLLDFYGDVLDDHTHSVMNSYYEDDLSLAEIAEGLAISRQGVRHLIKKGEDTLLSLESALGLSEFHSRLGAAEDKLRKVKDILNSMREGSENNTEMLESALKELDLAIGVISDRSN